MKLAQLFLVIADMIKAVALSSWVFAAFALPLPLAAVAGAYALGFGLSQLLAKKARLKLAVVSAHSALAAIFYFLFLNALAAAVDPAKALFAYFYPLLIGLVWLRAIWISKQSPDHAFCAIRLDEGLAIFLAGQLISNLGGFAAKGTMALLAPFMVFSALSLLASQRDGSKRGGLAPSGRIGAFASGVAAFAAAAYGLALLVPQLGETARASVKALGAASAKLLDFISRFLAWMFKSRQKGTAVYFDARDYIVQADRAREAARPVSKIVIWAALGIAGFVVLLVLADLIRRLAYWLLEKTPGHDDPHVGESLAVRLARFLRALMRSMTDAIARVARKAARAIKRIFFDDRAKRGPALRAYAALVAAGRRACLPRAKPETPREYAARLEREFPESARGSLSIAIEMEREVYGGVQTTDRPITPRIRATRLYAERIKKLCRPTSRRIASDTAPHNVHQGA